MKQLYSFMISICCLFLLIGCQKKAIHYPIRILAYNDEQIVLEEIVENFKKTFAPIYNEISISYIDYQEALNKDIDFYRDYDIFAMDTSQLEKFVEKKVIIENTLHSRQVLIYNAGGAAKASDYKGRVFNFPYTANSYLLYFDNNIYNSNDVIELEKMLIKKGNTGISALAIDFNDPYSLLSFYLGGKVQIFPDWDIFKVTLDSEQGIEITENIGKLRSKGVININYDDAIELFKNRLLGAIIAPIEYAMVYKETLKDRFAVAILPEIHLECTNSSFRLRPTVKVKAYGVNINAKSLNTSSELAYYLTSSPAQYLRFQKKKVYPTNKELSKKVDVKQDRVISTHLEQLQYSVPYPSSKKLDVFWVEFPKLMNELYEEKVYNIEERIKELSDKIRNA